MDRSFVMRMNDGGPTPSVFLQAADGGLDLVAVALIDLAHTLGIQVVAEGVEREAQLEQLVALGCEKAQGYLLSAALPASDIVRLVSAFRSPGHVVEMKGKRVRKDEPVRRAVG